MSKQKHEQLEARLDHLLNESISSAKDRERSTFDHLVSPLGGSYVLFGAGGLGQRTAAGLRTLGVEPLAFTDNNERLWNQNIAGVPVLAPAEAVRKCGSKAAFIVTIWSDSLGHPLAQIKSQLNSYGFTRVVSFVHLYWKYAETFLPYFSLDLPHKTLEQADQVRAAFGLWADAFSKLEYIAQVKLRLELDFSGLHCPDSGNQYFPDGLFSLLSNEVFVDCGAFNGDSIREFLRRQGVNFGKILAFEPDADNFSKLQKFVSTLDKSVLDKIALFPLALDRQKGKIHFDSAGATHSAIRSDGESVVDCVALDDILAGLKPTYIKMDIEGSEPEALAGAVKIIEECRPVLAISNYHRFDHLWKIPLFLSSLKVEYLLFLRPHAQATWDLICYAVPKDRSLMIDEE